jgi:hypothetical protein
MQTISRDDLIQRQDMIRAERREHRRTSAYPTCEPEVHEYMTTDGEATYKSEDDFSYDERLTGHIEEVAVILAWINNG